MRKLKIDFCDFWKGFDKVDNYFYHLLSKRYDLEINDNPEYLIYSAYGKTHRRYNCIKIYYTAENVRPDLWECDFAFSFDYTTSERHYRLPLYVLYDDITKLTRPKDVDNIVKSKSKFCNFLYSNAGAPERIDFFNKLSKYKHVDSGGSVMNNLGYPVEDKLAFIKDYKFTIAFENSSYPGYTTEKIFHPMLVNSIPIYWGNPLIDRDFNSKSFVNMHSFTSIDEVIEIVRELDNSDIVYKQFLQEPYFINNEVPSGLTEMEILNVFDKIFDVNYNLVSFRNTRRTVSVIRKDIFSHVKNLKKRGKRLFDN